MAKNTQQNSSFSKGLFSGNPAQILETIEQIRAMGNITVITDLLDLYCVSGDDSVKQAITQCLFDIKNQHAAQIMISAITQKKYTAIKTMLLESMWQSGLDYSNHAQEIILIICNDSFENALEAFTILETIEESLAKHERVHYAEMISLASSTKTSSHKQLLMQAIEMLA